MKRVLDVARIQLANWPTAVAYPLGLLAALLPLGLVIDISNGVNTVLDHQIFLLPSIYLVVALAHLQTMTQMFPFVVGLSVTRRAFYGATALVVAGQAMLIGLVLLGLQQAERMTGGWGSHVQIFGLDFLRQDNPVAQWLVDTVPFIAVSAVAVFAGVVFQRWRQTGIYLAGITTSALLTAVAVLVTSQSWWPAIGAFITDQPTLTVFAGLPLVLALLVGGAGWMSIRRATP